MENKFIVSARKYRPQNFNTVVGQSHITTTLKNAIRNNQLAHAFLFCGPRGVGKTTCARILAKTINCTNPTPDGEACNTCNSCVSFDAGTSLNIHELDAASNNSVDDIRTLVEQVRFAPQAGKYKVYIVDEVHMLSASAFNAFLKTLEEPPSYAIFILATTEKHKILPTILSRCQIFDFKRITNDDTVDHLQEIVDKEEIKAEKAALQVIAQKSEGCMRDSLSILDKIVSFTNGTVTYQNTLEHLNILDEDYYFKLLESMQQQDMAAAMLLFDEINRKGFEGDLVLNGFAEFIRNLLVCKDPKSAALLEVVEGMRDKYVATASKTGMSYLVSALNILNESEINYKMARNKRLHVELTLIKLNFLQQAIDLSVENGQVVKKKRLDGPVAFRTRPVIPVQFKPAGIAAPANEARLYIEQRPATQATAAAAPKTTAPVQAAPQPTAPKPAPRNMPPASGGTKKRLLDTLREKYGDQYAIEEVKEAETLNMEKLRECWDSYTAQLEKQQKHSSAGTFRSARLTIENDIRFTITVSALTSQKFVEQERMMLTDHLQTSFNNRTITFDVLVEASEREDIPVHMRLNSKQKFEHIAEQYPLVKELKERLKLEIDY
ncbi:MAG: DNA polymerase III subunit gamma/tau [Chitinophagaceae bacterium]|nr:DNA polymerase III subunit gamma/tau [Chitinophagaceae bacterium]MCA6451651.1 DNA polymerase III subunit gamma/tau [Chitinophagaceae bacterium]MCA6456274.1 DNA polymerase III subunit gamma/tau [Chitinophagaceae bacterium]MCA6460222.1 DNA polymerase III subunit gamma/tau [Chitinophagaceae bacterium]MCA6465109.1 DNA polymerase III subunit gamma/tau [Chitinophagaceae bacterium]